MNITSFNVHDVDRVDVSTKHWPARDNFHEYYAHKLTIYGVDGDRLELNLFSDSPDLLADMTASDEVEAWPWTHN